MDYEKYNQQRKAALNEFHIFLKELAKKGFTVQQLRIIGMIAREETEHIIHDIESDLVLNPNQSDLLK